MRFTGQVKIPDLDYPGLPAEVLVEDKQTELFVEGESLGRWSLVDVRAERLISSAFSLKLGGEEVTFLADQPTEFAYSGVDQMANVWARHKTMRFPLRMIANSRSRKGTKASRIEDLREAIEDALAGGTLNALSGRLENRAPTKAEQPQAWTDTGTSASEEPPAASPEQTTPARRPYRPAQPAPTRQGPPSHPRLEPVARAKQVETQPDHDPVLEAPDTPDSVFADPEPPLEKPPATDSVYKDTVPWAPTDRKSTEPEPVEPVEPGRDEDIPEPEPEAPEAARTPPPSELPAAPVPVRRQPSADTKAGVAQEPSPSQAPAASVPWMAPPAEERPPASEEPSVALEEPRPSRDKGVGEHPKYVVDLGAFEDRDDQDGSAGHRRRGRVSTPRREDAPEPLLASSERGGIMGAVRSAFVRTRNEHDHEYVEAPGGLGIKRQICAECGHISIGVSE